MKAILLLLIFFCNSGNAQDLFHGDKAQRPLKQQITVPEFVDSSRFKYDIKQLKILTDIYMKLKKDTLGSVFQYRFFVNKQGKIILSTPETIKFLRGINKYVESTFVKYKWRPSNRLGCNDCKVKSLGVLVFDFDTEKQQIICNINIENEKSYRVFHEVININ